MAYMCMLSWIDNIKRKNKLHFTKLKSVNPQPGYYKYYNPPPKPLNYDINSRTDHFEENENNVIWTVYFVNLRDILYSS